MSNAYVTDDDLRTELKGIVRGLADEPTWSSKNIKQAIEGVRKRLKKDHKLDLPYGTIRKLWYGTRDQIPGVLVINLRIVEERERQFRASIRSRALRAQADAQEVQNRGRHGANAARARINRRWARRVELHDR